MSLCAPSVVMGVSPWWGLTVSPLYSPGPRLSGGHSLHETSTVMVEPVVRAGSRGPPAFGGVTKAPSDAGQVVARGPGLTAARLGHKNHFTVDCSKAGEGHGRSWGLGWLGWGRGLEGQMRAQQGIQGLLGETCNGLEEKCGVFREFWGS